MINDQEMCLREQYRKRLDAGELWRTQGPASSSLSAPANASGGGGGARGGGISREAAASSLQAFRAENAASESDIADPNATIEEWSDADEDVDEDQDEDQDQDEDDGDYVQNATARRTPAASDQPRNSKFEKTTVDVLTAWLVKVPSPHCSLVSRLLICLVAMGRMRTTHTRLL